MTAWWLDGAKLDLSDICEEISAVIYDKSSVHCINIPLETMGSRGDILRRSSGKKWQVGSSRTSSFKVLSILRDGILMEVSKSLVEKGLKLNKQKKMCPTNFTFLFQQELRHNVFFSSDLSLGSLIPTFFVLLKMCTYPHPTLTHVSRQSRTPLKVRVSQFSQQTFCAGNWHMEEIMWWNVKYKGDP